MRQVIEVRYRYDKAVTRKNEKVIESVEVVQKKGERGSFAFQGDGRAIASDDGIKCHAFRVRDENGDEWDAECPPLRCADPYTVMKPAEKKSAAPPPPVEKAKKSAKSDKGE